MLLLLTPAVPGFASWDSTQAGQATNSKAQSKALTAPTALSVTSCTWSGAPNNAVTIKFGWTVSTSTFTASQKLYERGTGTPVSYATVQAFTDNTTHVGTDTFTHSSGSFAYKYAVSAKVGTNWESALTKTVSFTLAATGGGSCTATAA
ncbi:MAG TPA: hypothetical protein VFJ17_07860 [Mycobacteriales bacterium]|nr:hypothetical protein [Mycobacteriales bacterium]